MRYVFRADASRLIGAGHVMRMSAVAEALIELKENVIYVGHISELSWVENRISSLGFNEIHIDQNNFVSNPETDVLILDSYTISKDDLFINPSNWLRVISIVDEETPDYECDLRIHPGLDASWNGDSKTPILAGPEYIPLRKSIVRNKFNRDNSSEIVNFAVIAGGSDPFGLIPTIAKILHSIEVEFKAYLFTTIRQNLVSDPRIVYVEIGDQLEEITNDCDFIITTASTSCLEFLARGFPVGIVRVVENQDQNFKVLGQMGVAAQIGKCDTGKNWDINKNLIQELISSSNLRKGLQSKSRLLIDLHGSERIIHAIKAIGS